MRTRERDKGKRRTDRYRDRETERQTDSHRQRDRDTGREYKYECVVRYISEHGSIIPKYKCDRLGTYSNIMLQ